MTLKLSKSEFEPLRSTPSIAQCPKSALRLRRPSKSRVIASPGAQPVDFQKGKGVATFLRGGVNQAAARHRAEATSGRCYCPGFAGVVCNGLRPALRAGDTTIFWEHMRKVGARCPDRAGFAGFVSTGFAGASRWVTHHVVRWPPAQRPGRPDHHRPGFAGLF